MCKEMLVILVNRVVDKKKNNQKKMEGWVRLEVRKCSEMMYIDFE
jgi:hypothetical protein